MRHLIQAGQPACLAVSGTVGEYATLVSCTSISTADIYPSTRHYTTDSGQTYRLRGIARYPTHIHQTVGRHTGYIPGGRYREGGGGTGGTFHVSFSPHIWYVPVGCTPTPYSYSYGVWSVKYQDSG